MTIKNILVPTDFSENAMLAAEFASKIAMRSNAKITLLNAYSIPSSGARVTSKIKDVIAKSMNEKLDKSIQDLKSKFPTITFESKVRSGYLDEVIEYFSKSDNYDIIVMGTTGGDKIQNKLFGSNTSKLIQKSSIPVIGVPNNYNESAFKKMVLCVELPIKDKTKIERFTAIAKELDVTANIITITVNKTLGELEEEVKTANNEFDLNITAVEGEDFFETLGKYNEQNQINGIGILHKEYGFFEGLFHKSKTVELSLYYDKPILAL